MTVTAATSELGKTSEPADIVRTFLVVLEAGRLDEALALLADDVEVTPVSLPTVRGRAGVERLFRPTSQKKVPPQRDPAVDDLEATVYPDSLLDPSEDQRVGAFGQHGVAASRDRVAVQAKAVGLVRGLAGAVIPAFNRRWPGDSWETTAR